jgi:phage baseplate assembly protein gpV
MAMKNFFCKQHLIRSRRAALSFVIAFVLVFTSLFIVAPAVPMVAEQAGLTAHAAGPGPGAGLFFFNDKDPADSSTAYYDDGTSITYDSSELLDNSGGGIYYTSEGGISSIKDPENPSASIATSIPPNTIVLYNFHGMISGEYMGDINIMLMGDSELTEMFLLDTNARIFTPLKYEKSSLLITGTNCITSDDLTIDSGHLVLTSYASLKMNGQLTINGGSLTLRGNRDTETVPPPDGYDPDIFELVTSASGIRINGGTVSVLDRVLTLPTENDAPVINGGSVNLGGSSGFENPVNGAGAQLTSATIQFEGAGNDILVSDMHITAPGGGNYSYGTNDMRTDDKERVYIWAPKASVIVEALIDSEPFKIDLTVGLQSVKIIPVKNTAVAKYTVTVTVYGAHGTAKANGNKFSAGETVTLTCSPYTGYQFSSWSATKATLNNSTAANTTFKMPSADVSITCYFVIVPVTSIKSALKTVYVQKGKSVGVPYIAYGASGKQTILTWKASGRAVASVVKNAASGALTPSLGVTSKLNIKTYKVGTSKITLTSADQKSIVVKVVVVKKRIKAKSVGIGAIPKKLKIKKGKSISLTMKVKPSNTTGAIPSWRSSNSKVLKIDPFGRITAVKAGTAKITLSAGGKKKAVKIKVY